MIFITGVIVGAVVMAFCIALCSAAKILFNALVGRSQMKRRKMIFSTSPITISVSLAGN